MKRTLSLILVLAMAFSLMLGVIPSAEEEAEATGELVISHANLIFDETVYLLVAVNYTALGSAEGITLKVTNNKTSEESILQPDENIEGAPAGCVAFKYTELAKENTGDELTLVALLDGEASGSSKSYSLLEYALKARAGENGALKNLVNTMLYEGKEAQKESEHEGTYDLSKSWGLVVASGSNEGKIIAEIDNTVSFTPNVEKTGENAVLYDMYIEPVESEIAVSRDACRYFFIGDAQKTTFDLDMTTADENLEDVLNVDNQFLNDTTSYYVYFNGTTYTGTKDKLGVLANEGIKYNWVKAKLYNVVPTDANYNGFVASEMVTGENGYWKLYSFGDGKQSFVLSATERADLLIHNMEGGVFTFAITLGKDGTDNFVVSRLRFQGSSDVSFLAASGSRGTTYFNTIKNGDANETICSIKGVDGLKLFVTIYVVVDINANTLTYYNSMNEKILTETADASLADAFGIGSGTYNKSFFDWSVTRSNNQHLMLRKIKVFEGNIFE